MNEKESIGLFVNIASHEIHRSLNAKFDKLNFTSGAQGRVLGILADAEKKNESIYQKDIEKILCTRRSSVNNLISNLENCGYIERIPDATDARLKQLKLTECGWKAHKSIVGVIDSFEKSLEQEFTPQECEEIIAFMKRIIDHFHCDSESIHQ